MPFVIVRTTTPISPEQESALKSLLGEAITHIPGKSEQGLLLAFEDNCRLWLAGEHDQPIAYVEASVFANEDHAGYEAFSVLVALAMRDVLGIPAGRTYIRYADIPVWSVANMLIDRHMYEGARA
ncbi:MAG: hypothetical protein J6D34_00985 [Atopobiaceae bacterium]|nr:hypothetical protein [Atopobiaceae bacterium]